MSSRLVPVLTAGLWLVFATGCPLEWTKGVGFNDRAMRKDIRMQVRDNQCPPGQRYETCAEVNDRSPGCRDRCRPVSR